MRTSILSSRPSSLRVSAVSFRAFLFDCVAMRRNEKLGAAILNLRDVMSGNVGKMWFVVCCRCKTNKTKQTKTIEKTQQKTNELRFSHALTI